MEHEAESCGLADVASLRDGGDLLLYSDEYMSGRYARTAALAVSGEDIKSVRASDGPLFPFSAGFLEPAHARSLAEWTAVKQSENP